MAYPVTIRGFQKGDAKPVRDLFIQVNRLLAPPDMQKAFEQYIERSLHEEIDQISDYYGSREGGFWLACEVEQIAGMFGLEASGKQAMELRRMYVNPVYRRRGIARQMLEFAENECRKRSRSRLILSTSELQTDALALYQSSGYELLREEITSEATNKTLGRGIRRFHLEKIL